ncbi:hypothetical protein EZV62_011426 [Acer yangbiense]|uniref:TF-B3 domain-containing protein n=1 Tax=Acer yangbiense TaxID=1000413 RepID=A0A5C7I762_9ROSI|nr:hypothetical protein EZV62_011426 [Acer yangbiense]
MASSSRLEPLVSNSTEETPSHFFKVILPESLSNKKLDTRHVCEEIWEELSAFATLTAPNGRVWRVGLTKDGKRTWFDQVWHDFVEYHSITTRYLLVFKYEKNSNFHVLVFDLSACEINYSYYNREELENYKHKYSMHQDEMESEDSAELVHFRTPKPTSSSFEKNFPDKRRESKIPNDCEMQGKICKVEELEEENESNAVEESRRGKLVSNEMYNYSQGSLRRKRSSPSCARSPVVHRKDLRIDRTKSKATSDNNEVDEHPTVDEFELMAALEDAGISFAGRFRSLAAEERERALNVAKLLKPRKPSFMVILRSYHTFSFRNHLYVPAKFTNKYLSKDLEYIKLQASDGREYPVQIIWKEDNGVSFRKSWIFKGQEHGGRRHLEDILLKRIPEKFVRIFGDELSNEVTLTVPNGRVWQVGLTKEERKIWFHDGWHEFVQYHSISTGYFLVFKYGKKSTFNVLIFDLTACEIQYPYVKEEPEIVNEDSAEIMDFKTTPNPTFHTTKNKVFDKCSRSSSTMLTQMKRARTSFGSAFRSSKFKRSYEPQNKRSKLEEVVGSNQSNAYKVGTHSSDEATEFDEDEFMALLEDMGICVNKRFGNISAEKRERAITAARLFKPKNPSFMVISRSIDICLRRLYVPVNFANRYFSRGVKIIKIVDSEERKWSVQLSRMPMCFMTKMGGFAKKLDDGDVVVFELIKPRTLKVSVLKSVKSEIL